MRRLSISDGLGLCVDLLDYGARICSIDFHGAQLALGYDAIEDYLQDRFYLGATIGPIANRISQGKLTVDGDSLQMPCNEGENCLHSGGAGFDKQIWQVESQSQNQISFSLNYDMAKIGLKGQLTCKATYRVKQGCLSVKYRTHCDATCFINLTNHVYLNLSDSSSDISDHQFTIRADCLVAVDEHKLPTGQLRSVAKPFAYSLGNSPYQDLEGHCDHHFNTGEPNSGMVGDMLAAISSTTGIGLTVSSSCPGFQFYTGQYLGEPFSASSGFCVETQFAPDAINQSNFYSPLLKPNEVQEQVTHFQFHHST